MLQCHSWQRCSFILTCTVYLLLFSIATPALADWRKDIGIFRVGIVTVGDTSNSLVKMEAFRLALAKALDMDVAFFPAKNSRVLIDALSSERIEYAILSASGYALAWTSCKCVEPIAIPRSIDSTDGYHTVLIAAPDGPKSLNALSKGTIGVLSKDSITGHALAVYLLKKQNIKIDSERMPLEFTENSSQMLKEFSAGKLKMLLGWSSMTGDPAIGYSRGNLRQLSDIEGINVENYRILWKSGQIPHRPHVTRKKLDGEVKQILRITLEAMNEEDPLAYDSIEPTYGGGFVSIRHKRFDELIELIESLDNQIKTAEETLPLE